MKTFVALSALLVASNAQIWNYAGMPYAYGAAPLATSYAAAPIASATYAAAPIAATTYATAPAVVAAPAAAVSSQFHAQDELTNFNYGYSNINSQKQEIGNAMTGVKGAYQYVDATGKLVRTEYVADALGFRAVSNNLPVAPVFTGKAPVFTGKAPVYTGVAPEPVMDTAEVKAAKEEHMKLVEEAKARSRRSLIAPALSYASPLAYSTPLAYSAPLLRAPMTTVNYASTTINPIAAPIKYAAPMIKYAAPLSYGYAGLPALIKA